MKPKSHPPVLALIAAVAASMPSAFAAPEAIEVSEAQFGELPGGKEADGIAGDFLLRNDKVEAVISHNAPLRRANMSTFYGANGMTPGCLYDLTLKGADNDQITVFCPLSQQGEVSWVRIAEDGRSVEAVTTAAKNNGLYKRHTYALEDGWQGVLITTEVRNESGEKRSFKTGDKWTNFASRGHAAGITWADSIDPADRCGYAFTWVERGDIKVPKGEIELAPGESVKMARFLAVAPSPAEAFGIAAAWRGPVGALRCELKDKSGKPVSEAAVAVPVGDDKIHAYPDRDGVVTLQLPPGPYKVAASSLGRGALDVGVNVVAGEETRASFDMPAASTVSFDIADASGRAMPCKVQFHGTGNTKNPVLGPDNRAHGCRDQFHSEKGKFQVEVPPGTYRVVVTRGPEYSHHEQEIDVPPGADIAVAAKLERVVDTAGWMSTDFHNHSSPSGDNTCGTDDRVINLAAEHIEFAPTTEHNRLYDWRPHIEKLGLTAEIATVSGMELTGGGAHFNCFPLKPEPTKQDGGAPVWQKDPRLNAVVLRDYQGEEPDRWVQINHPDITENFFDKNRDGRLDGGYMALGSLIDGFETQNFIGDEILWGAPYRLRKPLEKGSRVEHVREFQWLQLLNQGQRIWGTAVADAHSVYGNGVGGWRTYVKSATDEPFEVDWRDIARNAKAGRMMLTTGPFLTVETGGGVLPGGEDRATGAARLKVKVQCNTWNAIDRVQVLVNGRQREDVNFTRAANPAMFKEGVVQFDQTIEVPLSQDAHLIVVAIGENHTIEKGFGTSTQASMMPCAYHNPIFIDVDGGGFQANHDTLDYPLPVHGLTVDQVKAILGDKVGR